MPDWEPEVIWESSDGQSLLYHGDGLKLMSSLPDNSVDCIWTDPPYLLSNDGFTCVAGRRVKVNKGDWDRSRGIELDHQINLAWLGECYRVLKPAGTIWVTGTLHIYLSTGMAMLQLGFRILNDITWEKPNPPPNLGCRCFTHSTETVLWATKAKKGSKARYTFHYEAMREENGGKQMKTVWSILPPNRDEKKYGKHPTQKPLALVERCLRASTDPGDLILDPFVGSGTTGIAALRLGRRFICAEREMDFAELAHKRLAEATTISSPTDFQTTVQGNQRRLLERRSKLGEQLDGEIRSSETYTYPRRAKSTRTRR